MNVDLRVALQEERAAELAARVRVFASPFGADERALDAGCGTGALTFALASLVAEVVGLDSSPEYLAAARGRAPGNVTFVEGDVMNMPFETASFDLAATARVLHHVRRPELAVAELARVTKPGGRILVVDQLGHHDPLVGLELDRFERARDPSHNRLLPDDDVRGFLEANDLVVTRNEIVREQRDLERYLDLAAVPDERRDELRALAPGPTYTVEVGWYLARKPA